MTNLISFRGLIGSGKTFAANHLVRQHGFRRIAFADALKLEVFDALWWREFPKIDDMNTDIVAAVMAYKTMFPDEHFRPRSLYYIDDQEKLDFINEHKLALRPLLQWWGTEYRRGQDENYWLSRWYEKTDKALANGERIVVDDARFENEFEVIDALKGYHIVIRVDEDERLRRLGIRDGAVNLGITKHASERAALLLSPSSRGICIFNDTTTSQFIININETLKQLDDDE